MNAVRSWACRRPCGCFALARASRRWSLGLGSPAIVIPDDGRRVDAGTPPRRAPARAGPHRAARLPDADAGLADRRGLLDRIPASGGRRRRLQVEREFACDDRVLGLGAGARDYAGHLLEIAYSLGSGRTPALAVGMARRGQLEGRLLAVLDAARNRRVPSAPGRLIGIGRGAGGRAAAGGTHDVDATWQPTVAADRSTKPPPRRQRPSRRRPAPVAGAPQTAPRRMRQPRAARGSPALGEGRPRCTSNCGRGTRTTAARSRCRRSRGCSASCRAARSPSLLKRDAGTFSFEGTVRNGSGAGAYTFTPSAAFADALQKRGIGRPTAAQQHEMAKSDVSLALLDDLTAQGYEKPTIDDLVRAGQHGVDPDVRARHGTARLPPRHSGRPHHDARPRRDAGLRAGADGAGAPEAVSRRPGARARPRRDARLRPGDAPGRLRLGGRRRARQCARSRRRSGVREGHERRSATRSCRSTAS